MELKQIKDLMAAMGRTGTKRLTIKKEGFELTLEHGEESGSRELTLGESLEGYEENPLRTDMELHRAHAFLKAAGKLSTAPSHPPNAIPEAPKEALSVQTSRESFITSPMVGTFYASAAPEDPPFVKAGDRVDKGTVVCIIEAMKVMNEVKANVTGTIAEALIENGQPIEFGTKLFRVIPE